MALNATLPCTWVRPAKLSRVVMMMVDRRSIQYFSRREDFPLLAVKLGIVSIYFFPPQNRKLKISSCVVVFTSFASTSLKYSCSLTSNKTFFFMYFVISLLTSIDLNKHERLTHIFTLYILIFIYPKGAPLYSRFTRMFTDHLQHT